jgi:hypothetical protein
LDGRWGRRKPKDQTLKRISDMEKGQKALAGTHVPSKDLRVALGLYLVACGNRKAV